MKNEVDKRIKKIIEKIKLEDIDSLGDNFILTKDLGFDSLGFIELVVEIENEFLFEFDIDYLTIDKIDQYISLLDYVYKKKLELK